MEREDNGGFIYVISDGTGFKIGVSVDPDERLKSLQSSNRATLTLEYTIHKNTPYKVESYLHRELRNYRGNGEWFEGITLNDIKRTLLLCTEWD